MEYNWATNKMKLSRAIGQLPLGASEEMILEKYRSMGGLVDESEVNKPVETPEEVATAPKRVTKKK